MYYIRKEIKKEINEKDFKEKINDFQQRDLLCFTCEKCGKSVEVKFKSKNGWEHGLLCRTCKTEITNLKKYGVTNVSKNKEIKEKICEVTLKKYGKKYFTQTELYKEKKEKTCLEKYGITNFSKSEIVKNKRKETCLKKYGVTHPMKISSVSELAGLNIMKKRFNTLKSLYLKEVTPLFNFDDYHGNKIKNKYKWKCNVCETIFEDHIYAGRIPRCPKCFGSKSYLEAEIADFLNSKGIELNRNIRFKTNKENIKENYELDIFIPKNNIGIEFDGLYWHNENHIGSKYHLEKYNYFKEIGINVINIFEDEWLEKKEIVISILLSKLGIFNNKYYARKCEIRKIKKIQEKDFLNKNHIQGFVGSSVCYGAFFNNELVSIMSFGKSRFNKKYEWELLRFANKINTTNIGIYNKIYKLFLKEYKPKSLISYCDLRYFSGAIYEKMGLEFINLSSPNYFYIKNKKRFSRIVFQKHKLKNILEDFDEKLTEKENMAKNGFDIIFDVGNKVFGKIYQMKL